MHDPADNFPPFTPIAKTLPDTVPFVAPEEIERNTGKAFAARLGANECAFGMSELAKAAAVQEIELSHCSWYGDPLSYELRQALARKHNLSMNNLCVDSGIDSLLGLSTRLYLAPGSVLVTSTGAYPTTNYHAIGVGAVVKSVPYKNYHEDVEALLSAAHEHNAALVYLANPDNPMGTRVSAQAIEHLIKHLPAQCLLLLDEAYIEFLPDDEHLPIDTSHKNLIRLRTFSKAYGLAGMRIGYAIAHESLIKGYDKVRNHFGVNRLAQAAALASVNDPQILPYVVNQTDSGKTKLYNMASRLNLGAITSYTNFVAIDFGSRDKANGVLESLGQAGIFLRKPQVQPLDRFIRVGVGKEAEQRILEKELKPLVTPHINDKGKN